MRQYSNLSKSLQNYWHICYIYHKFRKTIWKFFRSYSDLLSKFGEISLQEYVCEGISHPVFYGDLVFKVSRVKCEKNFGSSGSKIVNPFRCRLESMTRWWLRGLYVLRLAILQACTDLFLNHYILTKHWTSSPLIVSRVASVLGPELASRQEEHSLLWRMTLSTFDMLF